MSDELRELRELCKKAYGESTSPKYITNFSFKVLENVLPKKESIMNTYGITDCELIDDEWNYIKGWTDLFKYSIKQMISLNGSSFILSCISEAQHAPVDILMYYDTRPSAFNGVFDFYTFEKLKGYLRAEVYRELLEQLVEKCADYEDIGYDEVRKWFYGMTINIAILKEIDQRLREVGVKIRY